METGHFHRISCWIYSRTVPPLAPDIIAYYESKWDTETNRFIKENKENIRSALATYPSEYCSFDFHIVPQPIQPVFSSEGERLNELQKKANKHHTATTDKSGIIYCSLLQDKGKEDPNTQRQMIFNIEDCTKETIIAAIRLMSRMADKFKDEILLGKGFIDRDYLEEMWQIDLKEECPDFFETNKLWLEGKYDLFFTEPILEYNEPATRLKFVPSKKLPDVNFLSDFYAEALYILYWNHFDIIKEKDLLHPDNARYKKRLNLLKQEFGKYYMVLKGVTEDTSQKELIKLQDKLDKFWKRKNFSILRNKVSDSFVDHEHKRTDSEKYAKKMVTYYEMDGELGYVRLNSRDTVVLPDSLKRIIPVEPSISVPGYKLSRYNFFQKYFNGEMVVYNPFYNTFHIFTPRETQLLLGEHIPSALKTELIDNHWLVPEDRDELKWYENTYKDHNELTNRLSLTIMPTISCDLACPYCFERKRKDFMSEETEDAIIDWIKQQLSNHTYKQLSIDWFGGEPLLRKDRVVKMSARLMSICKNYEVTFTGAVTTNGLHLNDTKLLKELKESNVKTFQITFDGDRKAHNEQKFTQSERRVGTYDTLLNNVKLYCDYRTRWGGVDQLRVRINVTDDNYNSIEGLLNDLEAYKEQIVIFFRWVYANKESNWKEYSKQEKGTKPYVGIYRLQMMALLKGFNVDDQYDKCYLRFSHCEADSHSFYAIDPNGYLYQCVHEYDQQFAIGNVRDGITKQEEYTAFHETTFANDEECRACKWLPMCHGGCRRYRINHQEHLCIDEKESMELYIDILYSKKKFVENKQNQKSE